MKALEALRADLNELRADANERLANESPRSPGGMLKFGEETFDVLEAAKKTAHFRGRQCITTLDFLEAMTLVTEQPMAELLWKRGLASTDIARVLNDATLGDECDGGVAAAVVNEGPPLVDYEMMDAMKRRLRDAGIEAVPVAGQNVAAVIAAVPDSAAASATEETSDEPPLVADPNIKPLIRKVSREMPDVDAVEEVCDAILEGKLVAFPADTMFALAADATNRAAMRRLRAASGVGNRALGIWIHSLSAMRHVVKEVPADVTRLIEEFWPGPLTILFPRPANTFAQVSSGSTIGIRIPNHAVALSVLSMVNRPLAVTSIDPPEPGAVIGAKQAADMMAGWASLVLDDSDPPEPAVTTVISAAVSPYVIARPGAIAPEELEAVLGYRPAEVSAGS